MITEDYLMRMLLVFFEALMNAKSRALNEDDKIGAADLLDKVVSDAAQMDAATFLSLSPDSIAQILQATGTDPQVSEFMVRSLMQSADYRDQAGQHDIAALRKEQAKAIAKAYGCDMSVSIEDFLSKYDFGKQS